MNCFISNILFYIIFFLLVRVHDDELGMVEELVEQQDRVVELDEEQQLGDQPKI